MKNRKYNLLPYEIIVRAAAGEPEAVSIVIQNYTGYIKCKNRHPSPICTQF